MSNKKIFLPEYWKGKNKKRLSCKEKIKILNNNLDELDIMLKDVYDEAVLIGIDESQLKEV